MQGNTGISFTPKEVGEHLVSVKRDEKHIRNSPFKIKVRLHCQKGGTNSSNNATYDPFTSQVSPGDVGDASKVRSSGRGLKEGRTHEDNLFHVDTRQAG